MGEFRKSQKVSVINLPQFGECADGASDLTRDLGGQAVYPRNAKNADSWVSESGPPLLMGDRSGAQEAPRDLGCCLRNGMCACGIHPQNGM